METFYRINDPYSTVKVKPYFACNIRLPMNTIDLTVIDIINETEDTKTFILQPVDQTMPEYIPGQFITLVFHTGRTELRRTYSLSSSPFTDRFLSITVKRIDNGEVSRILHDYTPKGTILQALSPAGLFTFHPNPAAERDLFLLGAGSGIAPLYSILKSALAEEPDTNVTLIYSNHSSETTIYYDKLHALLRQYPERLRIIWLFSNAKNLGMARLNRDLLELFVKQWQTRHPEQALFYTCGPADYMMMCRITLLTMGYSLDQIRKETFVLSEDEGDDDDSSEPKVVDTNTYSVQLQFREEKFRFDVPYTQSILDVALLNNINLPYSCRAGICSTCSATCTRGNIRMQYNEVLTDREIENGRVLLCTAHPLDNNVVIVVE
jgi:ring-1,2-phenylacetyl-CoA epoxidase subunit PaaE